MPALSQEKLYTNHQRILNFINTEINIYIRNNSGSCEVFPAPFSVFLFADNSKYLEPDISVICDKSKIDNRVCRCKRIPDCRPI